MSPERAAMPQALLLDLSATARGADRSCCARAGAGRPSVTPPSKRQQSDRPFCAPSAHKPPSVATTLRQYVRPITDIPADRSHRLQNRALRKATMQNRQQHGRGSQSVWPIKNPTLRAEDIKTKTAAVIDECPQDERSVVARTKPSVVDALLLTLRPISIAEAVAKRHGRTK
jgi:hypothetical protein